MTIVVESYDMENLNPHEIAKSQIRTAATYIDIDKDYIERIIKPNKVIPVSFIAKVGGVEKKLEGLRVQHDNTLGPYKGGMRYHPEVSLDEVTALSMWMTIKCALIYDEYLDREYGWTGGGKGGLKIDPDMLLPGELEIITKNFFTELARYIGPYKDVAAPDINTDATIMRWAVEGYSKAIGSPRPIYSVVTGKPLDFGGSRGRESATSRGGQFALRDAANYYNFKLRDASVVVQGFGKVGWHFARLVNKEDKCKIIAVSDINGGIYCKKGLDPYKVKEHEEKTGSVVNFRGAENLSNEELLGLDCEVLAPAAVENAITSKNANDIKAEWVLELANGPTTPEAERILNNNGIKVLPDVWVNSGGVTVSNYELIQNRLNPNFIQRKQWSERKVNNKLKKRMRKVGNAVLHTAHEMDVDLRNAAYIVALGKLEKAMKA